MAILDKHKILETNATLLLIFSFLVVTIGGIVQITPASTNERLTAKGYKYFFRMPPRDDVQAWSTVQFLENKLKAKTIALIDDKQTYTAGLTANITKYAKENDKVNQRLKCSYHHQ